MTRNAEDGAGAPARRMATPLGVIDGKYALLRELGTGAAGVVYEAEHLVVGERVAIKVLHPRLSGTAGLRERFVGEARAAAQLGHENVVDVYDYGVTTDGRAFLVMELLVGETLEKLLERRGALPPSTACEIMVQVLAAVGAAHRFGIVHRDLKPANIVVTYPTPARPVVKVLDFGIAQRTNAGAPKHEGVLGTPVYMSPEQALGKAVDASADVYAAGVILYEMLAGEAPFTGTVTEVLGKVVAGKWRPLARVNPAVPRSLVTAVAAALATDRNLRVQTADELGRHLAPFLSRPPPHSIPGGPTSADAFPLIGTDAPGAPMFSDFPESRPPRDFPSLGLAHVAGKPRGEPVADSILQSPIIPRAPTAPKIRLFTGDREVESWSNAPNLSASSSSRYTLDEPVPSSEQEPAQHAVLPAPPESPPRAEAAANGADSKDGDTTAEETQRPAALRRAVWATAIGVGLGTAVAWLYRMG